MGSLNKVILVGNLGKAAEGRDVGDARVVNFSIATTETFKGRNGERQERTEWHRINYWGRGAEAIEEYLVKGKQVCVEGKLTTRKWQDKDGNDRYTTEVRADRVTLLGGGKDDRGGRRSRDGDAGDQRRPVSQGRPVAEPAGREPGADDDAPDDSDVPF